MVHDAGMNTKKDFWNSGFVLKRGFIDVQRVMEVRYQAIDIFMTQARRLGIDGPPDASMVELYSRDFQAFFNCGKQVQHLVSLHRLGLEPEIMFTLRELGISTPIISTRPVCYFNNPATASREVYHRVFAHQDWRSMQGSMNSIVVWLPLIDVPMNLGPLEVVPESHKHGLLTTSLEEGFGRVDETVVPNASFVPLEVKMGDALFFSSFLIHRSGNNTSGGFRWSCHFRYNDLDDPSFISRGYPHAYVYKPTPELLTPDFSTRDAMSAMLRENHEHDVV